MLRHVTVVLATVLLLPAAFGVYPKVLDIRQGTIVDLHEWKWDDIARECEEFLAPKGYAAVQTSPPHENLVVPGHPWNERLQVVSYKLISRSGNEEQLKDMLQRCNKVGVRVFAHVVLNHMTANVDDCKGVGGSTCNAKELSYPAVPYTKEDFYRPCEVKPSSNAVQIRECEVHGLHKLNQKSRKVEDRMVEYLNHLIDIGFAGFRINAAVHMYPAYLSTIYNKLNNLNSSQGLPDNTMAFIYHEINDLSTPREIKQKATNAWYLPMGSITHGKYGYDINKIFQKENDLYVLRNFGDNRENLRQSVAFIDGYEFERGGGSDPRLNYKTPIPYKIAIAFLLAWGRVTPQILSSYEFDKPEDGPPSDDKDNILSPEPDKDNKCKNKWVCQHRWRPVYSMVEFHRATQGLKLTSWWDNGQKQIAFAKGNVGFIAINMEDKPLDKLLHTNLPAGKYCDMISGSVVDGNCQGTTIEVNEGGYAQIHLPSYKTLDNEHDGFLAILNDDSSGMEDPK